MRMMYLVPLEFHQPFGPSISLIFRDARTPGSWSKHFAHPTLALIYRLTPLSLSAAINNLKQELHATDQEISQTLSVFIIVQGATPILWSALSEIRGRKARTLIASIKFPA